MRLVVFDVDGTLTDTNEVDWRCYAAALERCFGIGDPEGFDWARFENVTDTGILSELLRARQGRAPAAAEVEGFVTLFLEELRRARASRPDCFRQVAGAAELLAALSADPEWRWAVATGGFLESALLKLEWSGLAVAAEAVVSARFDPRREAIFGEAVRRSRAAHGDAESVVLVGDGVWDVRTASRLGFGFLGVGSGQRRQALERAGAARVVGELRPVGSVMALLRAAGAPRRRQRMAKS